ncbi:MAG TPA: MFS transporter [Flavobacteriales bacterium]|nr:MFS transporter [Flavobacteriales bacterium]
MKKLPDSDKTRPDPFAALRIRDFVLFMITRFFLTLGIQMQSVIVGWQVYEYTKDVLALGMIGLAEAIPFIITSLFSGHVADTVNRKKIILVAVSLLLVSTSALLYFSLNNAAFIKLYGIVPIFLVIGFTGIVRGFIAAATMPFLAQLLPRGLYANAATWNSSIWHTGAVIGPALAGLICSYGFAPAYAVNFIFIAIAVFAFVFIASRPLPAREKNETLKESLNAGIKFVFSNQLLLGAISLDLFAVLFGGAVAMLPAFADDVLFAGPVELGFLRASPAIGAIVTAIILAYKPPGAKAGMNLMVNVALFGVATILFAFSTNFYLSLFLLALTGAFDNVSVVVRHTVMQLSTPDHMRGRVSAINSIFIGSSNEIGAFESGLAASLMGLQTSVVFGGVMTIIVVLITAKLAPKLRKLNLEEM